MRRTCTCCGVEKRLGDFYRHARGPAGRETQCKVCRRRKVYENRELKRDVYCERARARYASDPEYRARKRASWLAWVRTPQGRESRRITQRAARAFKRALSTSATEQRT